jgi:hypothetical protein
MFYSLPVVALGKCFVYGRGWRLVSRLFPLRQQEFGQLLIAKMPAPGSQPLYRVQRMQYASNWRCFLASYNLLASFEARPAAGRPTGFIGYCQVRELHGKRVTMPAFASLDISTFFITIVILGGL